MDFGHLLAYYSANPEATPGRIKQGEIDMQIDCSDIHACMERRSITGTMQGMSSYHFKRHRVHTKPLIMYMMGDSSLLDKPLLGIVGPRKPSVYAQQVTQDLFGCIDPYDLVTISGGAPGIDTLCHDLSVRHTKKTIMVLGGGLLYYRESRRRTRLQGILDAGGLILSEYKLYQEPAPWTFPERNRIIAGLADALFVPAAGEKSGSLITVDFARRMGTPVYTVPGSIYDATSAGTNNALAQEKIHAVVSPRDVLDLYFHHLCDVPGVAVPTLVGLAPGELEIMHLLEKESYIFSDLVSTTEMSAAEILGHLSTLQLGGHVDEDGGTRYRT